MLRLLVFGWFILAGSLVYSEELTCGHFSLSRDKLLRLQYRGLPLAVKDSLDYSPGFEQAEQAVVAQQQGKQVLNVVRSQGAPVTYRKEVAVGPEGVELTVKYKLPAYKNDLAEPSIRYAFYVPMQTLAGAKWKAYTGRAHSAKVSEGKVGSSLSGIRYIAFRSDRVRLVFDFNPQGVCADGDYCSYGEPVGCWSMQREGEFLVFSFGYRAAFYGGVFMSKCLIYEGDYDYNAQHAWRTWGYRGKTLPTKLFAFGTAQPAKEATAADLSLYARERGYGWRQTDGLTLVRNSPTGLVNNSLLAAAGKEGLFLVDLVPGRWLLTVRIASGAATLGPMEILLNGRSEVEGVLLAAGEVRTITLPVDQRRTGPLEIGFRGAKGWAVSSIALQPLLYRNEDFALERGLWNVDGIFTPH